MTSFGKLLVFYFLFSVLVTKLLTDKHSLYIYIYIYIFSNVTEFEKYIRSAQLNCSFYL
jgi:hypothetical protein